MAKVTREAGFTKVEVIATKGKSGVFATLDSGATTTLAVYFVYDAKQNDRQNELSPGEATLSTAVGWG